MACVVPLSRMVIPIFLFCSLAGCNGGGSGRNGEGEAVAGSLLPSRFMLEGCQACIITIEVPEERGEGSSLKISLTCEAQQAPFADGTVGNGFLIREKAGVVEEQVQVLGKWHLYGAFGGSAMRSFAAECSGRGSGGLTGFEVLDLGVQFVGRQDNADGRVETLRGEATCGDLALRGFEQGGSVPLSGCRVVIDYRW